MLCMTVFTFFDFFFAFTRITFAIIANITFFFFIDFIAFTRITITLIALFAFRDTATCFAFVVTCFI